MFTRKAHLRPGEISISSAKRLLQQYLPIGDIHPHSPLIRNACQPQGVRQGRRERFGYSNRSAPASGGKARLKRKRACCCGPCFVYSPELGERCRKKHVGEAELRVRLDRPAGGIRRFV